MKTNKLIKFAASLMLCCMFFGCSPEDETEKLGTIYGTVTDFSSGEPIANVNVRLNPRGETTLTGMDGTFEFVDLPAGSYSLSLSKNGYVDLDDDYVIKIENGNNVQRAIQLQKLHYSLQIVDNDGHAISVLDFGIEEGVIQKTFSIFNNGNMMLEYTITKTANWVEEIIPPTGTVGLNDSKPIHVIINRELLEYGENNSNLLITTMNTGGMELPIKATKYGLPVVTTCDVTNITAIRATCSGNVTSDGGYEVTSRGMCWSKSPHPTINDNVATNGNGMGSYSCEMRDLRNNTTYYVRAFAENSTGVSYGEEKIFETELLPSFQYGGFTFYVAPDLGNAISWNDANSYCNNLTIYGLSGWRLPTKDELLQMYSERDRIGGFVYYQAPNYYGYWSSTMVTDGIYQGNHFLANFFDGTLYCGLENNQSGNSMWCARVRPIRRKN